MRLLEFFCNHLYHFHFFTDDFHFFTDALMWQSKQWYVDLGKQYFNDHLSELVLPP
eukprot:SAG25_NODE_4233_length_858_cov_2.350461_1_plen_55_part_10